MKKMMMFALAMGLWLVQVAPVQADTFAPKGPVNVRATADGKVYFEGPSEVLEDYFRIRVFCPDQLVCGGNNTWGKIERIDATHAVAQMDMDAVKNLNQRAFNPRNSAGQWSPLPNRYLTLNGGLVLERSTKSGMNGQSEEDGPAGGCHYTFVADLASYTPSGSCEGGYAKPQTSYQPEKAVSGKSGRGEVAVASEQGAAAAHNSAAGTTGAIVANNSSIAQGANMFNVNQVNGGGKGKKGKGKGNTSIIYAPNASQRTNNYAIKGSSADVKAYHNKGQVLTYVGPTYQTVVIGKDTYEPDQCIKCHSKQAEDDVRMKNMIFKNMSCTVDGTCWEKKKDHAKGHKAHGKATSAGKGAK